MTPKNVNPLSLFITGDAGFGKSGIIEICHAFLTKTSKFWFSYAGCPEKVKILLLPPTGVSVINISETTTLQIPDSHFEKKNTQNEHIIAHFEYFFTCHYSKTVWLAENLNDITITHYEKILYHI